VGTLTIVRFRIIGDKIITRTCKLPLTYVTLNDRLVDIRGVPIVCLLSVLSIKWRGKYKQCKQTCFLSLFEHTCNKNIQLWCQ
jgi:hypothetical protein